MKTRQSQKKSIVVDEHLCLEELLGSAMTSAMKKTIPNRGQSEFSEMLYIFLLIIEKIRISVVRSQPAD